MTSCDYNMVMKSVGIADLKARLSAHLKDVRGGRTLVVVDRTTPVARIVPFGAEPLDVRRAKRAPSSVRASPRSRAVTDSLATLLEDRARR